MKKLQPTTYDPVVRAALIMEETDARIYQVSMQPEQALEFGLALEAMRLPGRNPACIVELVHALHRIAHTKAYAPSSASLSLRIGREYSRVIYARVHGGETARWLKDVRNVCVRLKIRPDEISQEGVPTISATVRLWWD